MTYGLGGPQQGKQHQRTDVNIQPNELIPARPLWCGYFPDAAVFLVDSIDLGRLPDPKAELDALLSIE